MKLLSRTAIALVAPIVFVLGTATAASAEPIGTFGWVYDTLFDTGSAFSVTNESADPFSDVFVDLYAPGAADPFQSISLGNSGTIDGSTAAQSLEELLFVPSLELDRVHLRFVFDSMSLSADLFASALAGESGTLLATSADLFATESAPEPIPEPGTLLLLGSGISALVLRRARGCRDRGDRQTRGARVRRT